MVHSETKRVNLKGSECLESAYRKKCFTLKQKDWTKDFKMLRICIQNQWLILKQKGLKQRFQYVKFLQTQQNCFIPKQKRVGLKISKC